ncbi:hypothetical protein M9Y10_011766 [Tritrichomonas musculus]|uniref:FERM domain-containing protein n=1 Tax=Tritrichomonas musculus TaxID=1915356 RepID=A0ABR2IK86_9EUKA
MESIDFDLDDFYSEEEETKDFIQKKLIVNFDKDKQNISFSSIKLESFYFKPLPNNFDTLIFCAFFASHFDFLNSYSYIISRNKVLDCYDKNSVKDINDFSLNNPDFKSFSVLVYYQNECLLNIQEFIKYSAPLYPEIEFSRIISQLIHKEPEFEIDYLLMTSLIQMMELTCAYYYHEFAEVNNDDEIKEVIGKSLNELADIPRFYIFRVKNNISYHVAVDTKANLTPEIKTELNYRIVWGILEDELFYVDDDGTLYKFSIQTLSFINQGRNAIYDLTNLILACYTLDTK